MISMPIWSFILIMLFASIGAEFICMYFIYRIEKSIKNEKKLKELEKKCKEEE